MLIARRHGAKIVWTVHNRLPHELRFPEEEVSLYRHLNEWAHAIHVMSPATEAVIADVVSLDRSKIQQIDHPSYRGYYPSSRGRDEERAARLIDPRALTVLFFGQIRPYKGLDLLAEAISIAQGRSAQPITFMLAGALGKASQWELEGLLAGLRNRVVSIGHVPDREVAGWFAAADVAIFPYRDILNSGSLHLSGTFGVPAILPDLPHIASEFSRESWVRLFDARRPVQSLAARICEELPSQDQVRVQTERFAQVRSPWSTSVRYGALLESLA